MGRHISFWIGFFAAALLIVPIALFAWGLAQDRLFDLMAMVFGAMVVLIVLLIVVLVFRGPILRRVLGRGEASVEEITRSLVAGVSAAATGDRVRAEAEADTLARVAIGWYTWSNFYRWVIGTVVALLVAFATFTGSVLLFEQTQKIGQQTEVMEAQTALMEAQTERLAEQTRQAQMGNELSALSMVTELRTRLLSVVDPVTVDDIVSNFGNPVQDQSMAFDIVASRDRACTLGFDRSQILGSAASDAALRVVEDQARDGLLSERMRGTLSYLVQDGDGSVALSALIVMDRLGLTFEGEAVQLAGVHIDQLSLAQAHRLSIENSVVAGLDCPACEVTLSGSFAVEAKASKMFGRNNIVVDFDKMVPVLGVWLPSRSTNFPAGDSVQRLRKLGMFQKGRTSAFLRTFGDMEPCYGLAQIAENSRIFEFRN